MLFNLNERIIMTSNIDNNTGYMLTEESVLKEIEEYNNRRSGPILDGESKAKGLERFFKEVLHEKAWGSLDHLNDDTKPVGLTNDNSDLEN